MGSRYRVHPEESDGAPSEAAPVLASADVEAPTVVGEQDLGALFAQEPPGAAPAPRSPRAGSGEAGAKLMHANVSASGDGEKAETPDGDTSSFARRNREAKQSLKRTPSFAKRSVSQKLPGGARAQASARDSRIALGSGSARAHARLSSHSMTLPLQTARRISAADPTGEMDERRSSIDDGTRHSNYCVQYAVVPPTILSRGLPGTAPHLSHCCLQERALPTCSAA